jgi:hypothetical protein
MRQQQMFAACMSLAGLTVMGCAHATTPPRDSVVDTSVRRDAVCREAVVLYSSASEVRAPFQAIAVIDFSEKDRMMNEAVLMDLVRRKAASMGASGVILPDMPEFGVYETVVQPLTERGHRSIAVYVPEDSARVRVTCEGN